MPGVAHELYLFKIFTLSFEITIDSQIIAKPVPRVPGKTSPKGDILYDSSTLSKPGCRSAQ